MRKVKGYFLTMTAAWLSLALLAACNLTGITPTTPTTATVTAPLVTASPAATKHATDTLAAPASIETFTPTVEPSSPESPTPIETEPVPPLSTPVLGPTITHLPAGTKINIISIHMIDPLQGWGIGRVPSSSDHVFRTQDGGSTWQDVTPPQPDPAANVQIRATGAFRDATSAWVVYAEDAPSTPRQPVLIWYTRDGGSSWKYGLLDISNIILEFFIPSDLVFQDKQHGWLLAHVGAGMMHDYVSIAATTDGGLTWQFVISPTNDNYNLACAKNGMAFADAKTGWLTVDCNGIDSQPYLYRTSDGGSSWEELDIPAPQGDSDYYNKHACGMHYPTLFSTTSAIFAMRCRDNATYKIDQDYLYRTSDAGNTWQIFALPADFSMPYAGGGLYFTNDQAGLAFSRMIYKTNDGGQSWSLVKQVYWDGQFSFLDLNTGWAAANSSGEYGLVMTSDGAKTLTMLNPVVGP
jgi:photosystem II stability/assembly factor-like uncharacterized protein